MDHRRRVKHEMSCRKYGKELDAQLLKEMEEGVEDASKVGRVVLCTVAEAIAARHGKNGESSFKTHILSLYRRKHPKKPKLNDDQRKIAASAYSKWNAQRYKTDTKSFAFFLKDELNGVELDEQQCHQYQKSGHAAMRNKKTSRRKMTSEEIEKALKMREDYKNAAYTNFVYRNFEDFIRDNKEAYDLGDFADRTIMNLRKPQKMEEEGEKDEEEGEDQDEEELPPTDTETDTEDAWDEDDDEKEKEDNKMKRGVDDLLHFAGFGKKPRGVAGLMSDLSLY